MKVLITSYGDPSVGIPQVVVTITCPDLDFEVECNRKVVRQKLLEFWSDWFDEQVGVLFQDECPDCGRLGWDGVECSNSGCVNNESDTPDTTNQAGSDPAAGYPD